MNRVRTKPSAMNRTMNRTRTKIPERKIPDKKETKKPASSNCKQKPLIVDGMVRMINYYDKNKAQRWDMLQKEGKNTVVLVNIFGESVEVPKRNIIGEKKVTVGYLRMVGIDWV